MALRVITVASYINSPPFPASVVIPKHHSVLHPFSLPIMVDKTVLVTGGAGYIGSHTVLQLLFGGFKVVVVDNLDNSSEIAIHRVKELACEFANNISFHKVPTLVSFLIDFT